MGQINLIFDVNGVIKDHMHAWDEFNMREFNLYGFSQIYYSCIYEFGERERERERESVFMNYLTNLNSKIVHGFCV